MSDITVDQLITDHVSRPGVTQQAKLRTALRDFITEFEKGAHRETFSKGDLYRRYYRHSPVNPGSLWAAAKGGEAATGFRLIVLAESTRRALGHD